VVDETTVDAPAEDSVVPQTGDPATDAALAGVAELGDDLSDHVDALRQAQQALHDWLRRD